MSVTVKSIMLNVVMRSVVMLNVVAPNATLTKRRGAYAVFVASLRLSSIFNVGQPFLPSLIFEDETGTQHLKVLHSRDLRPYF